MKKEMIFEILRKYNLLLLLVIFIIISASISENFLTFNNLVNILQQSSITGIVAIGMTFVILVGGIDLSVGSVAALSGMIVAILLSKGYSIFVSILASIMVGLVLGAITGFVITKFNIPDFIASLSMMVAARGMTLLTTNGKPIFGLNDTFRLIGAGNVFGIPISGIIWICLTIISAIILKYTIFGRNLYALGGNKESAFLSGIRIKFDYVMVYVISGGLSALGGVVLSSWLSVGQPTAGQSMELDAIASVVLGGTSLSGGRGGVWGTLGGIILMTFITNIFNLKGLSSYYQQIFMGIIIILALTLNNLLFKKNK